MVIFDILMRFKPDSIPLFKSPELFQTFEQTDDLLVVKGNELHRYITLLIMGFSVVYAFIGFIQGHILPSVIIACLLPFTFISYLVFNAGHSTSSKVINLVTVSTCIVCISGYYGPTAFAQAFFIPLLSSTLIVFQGKERKLGIMLAAFVFIAFLLTVGIDFRIGHTQFSEEQLKTERTMNLIGASVVTLLEVLVVITISNQIQHLLLEQTRSLNATIGTRDKMMAILSHDLRSPLALISSALNIIAPKLPLQSDEKHMMDELTKRANATLVMVDNLLLWSMAQTSQIGFQPEEIYFADIHKMMQGFVELHLNKKVHVVCDIPKQGSVIADRNLLQIILRNLYSNAVKYSYENGTISLSLVAGEHKAEIILSDTGAGMDAEKAEEIRAGRAASTQGTQNESGNGLGLMVVRDFLKMHQTELTVQSKPGKGSAFSFQLPLAVTSH